MSWEDMLRKKITIGGREIIADNVKGKMIAGGRINIDGKDMGQVADMPSDVGAEARRAAKQAKKRAKQAKKRAKRMKRQGKGNITIGGRGEGKVTIGGRGKGKEIITDEKGNVLQRDERGNLIHPGSVYITYE